MSKYQFGQSQHTYQHPSALMEAPNEKPDLVRGCVRHAERVVGEYLSGALGEHDVLDGAAHTLPLHARDRVVAALQDKQQPAVRDAPLSLRPHAREYALEQVQRAALDRHHAFRHVELGVHRLRRQAGHWRAERDASRAAADHAHERAGVDVFTTEPEVPDHVSGEGVQLDDRLLPPPSQEGSRVEFGGRRRRAFVHVCAGRRVVGDRCGLRVSPVWFCVVYDRHEGGVVRVRAVAVLLTLHGIRAPFYIHCPSLTTPFLQSSLQSPASPLPCAPSL